jgi:hypothetical protein
MCLDYINEVHLNPKDNKWITGYKIMIVYENGPLQSIVFPFRYIKEKNILTERIVYGKIYKDQNNSILSLTECGDIVAAYLTGFHVFPGLYGAASYKMTIQSSHRSLYKIVKVKYRKVTTIGRQSTHKCVVAKEIEFLED